MLTFESNLIAENDGQFKALGFVKYFKFGWALLGGKLVNILLGGCDSGRGIEGFLFLQIIKARFMLSFWGVFKSSACSVITPPPSTSTGVGSVDGAGGGHRVSFIFSPGDISGLTMS